MLRFALHRLIHALSLALGVVLVLFLVFESGLTGDPAQREAGRHSSARTLGEIRLRLGLFESFEATALRLRVEGSAARYFLEAVDGPALRLSAADDSEISRVELAGLDLAALHNSLAQLELPQGRSLWTELRADPNLPAAGLASALHGARLAVDHRRTADLGWAQERPAWRRFLHQSAALLRFDFGSDQSGQAIAPQLWQRGKRSLALALPAFVLGTVLAVAAALFALSRRGWTDRSLAWLSSLMISVSALATILFLRALLAGKLGWFPVAGWEPPHANYLMLPILTWVAIAFWPEYRLYRALLGQQAGGGYLTAARARGVGEARLMRRHLLPNAWVALITQATLALPFLALGSILLERVFAIPGLGSMVAEAALNSDQALLRAVAFLLALVYLAAQWLGDLLCGLADPRYREARA